MKPETRAEIIRLWKIGRPKAEISNRIGVSEGTVRRIALAENLLKLGSDCNGPTSKQLREAEVSTFNGNVFEEAAKYLGGRYKESLGQIFLDGRPASIKDVMIAANTYLARHNEPQLGKNEAWKIVVEVQKEV